MGLFSYRALNQAGELVVGDLQASSKDEAATKLSKMQFTPLELKKKKTALKIGGMLKSKVKPGSILIFTKQLHSLIKAGVPLLDSLISLKDQTTDENLATILKSVVLEIEMGNSFSQSLKKHPDVFSVLYTNSIKIGEITGNLDAILKEIAFFLADDIEMKKNIKKATRYPIMVFTALLMAFVVFIVFVIPKFVPIFEKGGQELPMPTKMILFISTSVTSYWLPILAVIGLGIFGFVSFYNTPRGKRLIHYYMLEVPVYGNLLRKISIQRFSRTIALLNRSGIPLIQAINITEGVETNLIYKEEIEKIKQQIEKGISIAGAMRKSTYFPALMIHMIAVGEKSGMLDDMLYEVAEFNNDEIKQMIENLTALIEPIITVVLGVMVLFLALSIFLPMWNMLSFLK